jgi:hypothetical protein
VRSFQYKGTSRPVRGTKTGRPFGRPMLDKAKTATIRAELARGTGIIKTARLVGCGVSAVQRIKADIGVE